MNFDRKLTRRWLWWNFYCFTFSAINELIKKERYADDQPLGGGGAVAYQGGGVQGGGMGASLGGGARPACIGANLKAALSRAPRSLFFLLVDFCPRTKGAPKGGANSGGADGDPRDATWGGGGLGFSPRTFLNRSMSVARGGGRPTPPVAHP